MGLSELRRVTGAVRLRPVGQDAVLRRGSAERSAAGRSRGAGGGGEEGEDEEFWRLGVGDGSLWPDG